MIRLVRCGPALLALLFFACGRGTPTGAPVVGPTATATPAPSPAALVYGDLVRTGGSGPVPADLKPAITLAGSQPADGGRVTFGYDESATRDLMLSLVVTAGADSTV